MNYPELTDIMSINSNIGIYDFEKNIIEDLYGKNKMHFYGIYLSQSF